MLELNDLLRKAEVDPRDPAAPVLVARHSSSTRAVAEALRLSVIEDRGFIEGYQRTQSEERNEGMIRRAGYLASFVSHRPQTDLMCFSSILSGLMPSQDYVDRLEVGFNSPISWLRLAHRNVFPIVTLQSEGILSPALPSWDDVLLSTDDVLNLPLGWRAAMSQWRGVYCIIDVTDGRTYVGSATGRENILARWSDYAATGHGGIIRLRGRDVRNFRFAVLQLVAPDLPRDDVIRLENSWMRRLQTRTCGLNGPERPL